MEIFFLLLAKSSGSLIIIEWLFIVFSHLAMRRSLDNKKDDESQFKAWFHPYNWIAIIALITIMLSQAINPDSRFQFWTSLVVLGIAIGAYLIRSVMKRKT